jgi:hypothetical protein
MILFLMNGPGEFDTIIRISVLNTGFAARFLRSMVISKINTGIDRPMLTASKKWGFN